MKKHIGRFLVEIIIIFIGITLSFLFEEFREDHKNLLEKREIISSLLTDLQLKEEEIINDSKEAKRLIILIDTCFYLSKNHSFIPKQIIDGLITGISYDYGGFNASTPTFLGLSNSGIWQQLPDTLRRQIFDLYNGDYSYVHNTYEKSTEYVSFMKIHSYPTYQINFFNEMESGILLEGKEVDYVKQINETLTKPEFRSTILVIRNELTKIMRTQKRSLKSQKRLIKNLKTYLAFLN